MNRKRLSQERQERSHLTKDDYLVACHEAGHVLFYVRALVAQFGRKWTKNILKSLKEEEKDLRALMHQSCSR